MEHRYRTWKRTLGSVCEDVRTNISFTLLYIVLFLLVRSLYILGSLSLSLFYFLSYASCIVCAHNTHSRSIYIFPRISHLLLPVSLPMYMSQYFSLLSLSLSLSLSLASVSVASYVQTGIES